MSQASPGQSGIRRYSRRLLVGLFALPLILFFGRLTWFIYLSEPSRQIAIGPETTYLTGPLTDDGYVDYIAAINERQSEGVTPENNAVVLLVQAYGAEIIHEDTRERYFELLNVTQPPTGREYFIDQVAFAQLHPDVEDSREAVQEFEDQHKTARQRPWTRSEFPDVAALLDRNAEHLALIVEASRRERFYSPLLSDEEPPWMFGVLLPVEQEQRAAARQLTARSMLQLEEGDVCGAWDDIMACHRLARLTGQAPFLISSLVSFSVDSIPYDAAQALMASRSTTADQARSFVEEMQRLSPLPSTVESAQTVERLAVLDAVILTARGEVFLEEDRPLSKLGVGLSGAIDWNRVLRLVNSEIDKRVEALRDPHLANRSANVETLDEAVRTRAQPLPTLGLRAFAGDREGASRDAGWTIINCFLPALEQMAVSETRGIARERLLLAGFALTAYQREQGAYPESLAAVVPDLLSEVPIDPWSGNELIYRRTDDGFVVYSVDQNLKDDGGVSPDVEAGRSEGDIVLRVGNE